MSFPTVKLKGLLSQPVRNGYSPVCTNEPTSKRILGLGALTDNMLDIHEVKWVPESNAQVDSFVLSAGDFLVSRSNTLDKVGRAALFRGELENCSYPDLMMRFRVDESKINPEFLEDILRSFPARKHFKRWACGTSSSMVKITKIAIESLSIPVPSISEQLSIVEVMSLLDELIYKTEKLVRQKKYVFRAMVGGFIYQPTKAEYWPEECARELFQERNETGRSDLSLLSITNDLGVIPRDETNRKDTSNEDKSKYRRICPGDIGYNTMRMWQGVSALSELEGIVSPAYTVCIPGERLDPLFVSFLFKTPFMIHRFYRYSQGLTPDTWNLKYRHFGEVKVPVPPIEEQRRIAELLSTAQQEITLLKQQVENYKLQKRGLMQKLLTGEWRVKTDKEVA